MGEHDKGKIVLLLSRENLRQKIDQLFLVNPRMTIIEVADADEGIRIARNLRPDLICTGLDVLGMSMDECYRKIKMAPELRAIPLVIMTKKDKKVLSGCIRSGSNEIIKLPPKRDEFTHICRKYLGMNLLIARENTNLTIHFNGGDGCLLKPYSVILCDGGIFLQTDSVLPLETSLTFSFYSATREQTVEIDALVSWANLPEKQLAPKLPTGMGLRFPDVPSEDIWIVRELVQQTEEDRRAQFFPQTYKPSKHLLDVLLQQDSVTTIK